MLNGCPRCGEQVPPGARACDRCGFDLTWEQAVVTTAHLHLDEVAPATSSQMELLRHATMGEFEILSELGRGGMATVYLAHDIQIGRKVALKVISHIYLQQPDVAERFKREARTAGALSHPHIIPIHAVREEEHLLYFVMKYVPGRSLDSVLAETVPLPLAIASSILYEVGSALDYAHRNGVIHRDVKPGNIMIDEEGFSVITDFGIAKAAEGVGLTQTGTVVGTPAYVSPEACEGMPATALSDQYSLGVVAYQMLCGDLPFQAQSGMSMMYAHIHTPPEPLGKRRPDLPRDLTAAIMRMLAKEPEERWPSVKDAVAAIAALSPPPDEDLRAAVITLARNRADRPSASSLLAPMSPTPMPRRTPPKAKPAVVAGRRSDDQVQVVHKVALWPMVLGALLAVGGAGVVMYDRAQSRAATAVPDSAAVTATADSLWLDAKGKASLSRANALAAGAVAKALLPGDSLTARAESLAALGQKAEGAVLLTQAVAAWTRAEQIARTPDLADASKAPANSTATAPPIGNSTAAPNPPTPAIPSLPDSQQVAIFYERLAGFIQARQLGEMQRLRTNMSSSEEGRWRDLFTDPKLESVHANFTVQSANVQAGRLYSRLRYSLSVTRGGKVETKRQTLIVELTRGPDGLREVSWEEVGR